MKLSSLLGAAAAAVTLNLHVSPASSHARDGAFEMVSDAELDASRGGFLAADNLAFQFGAVMRTYENGALSLQTQLVWTPEGTAMEQSLGDGVTQLTGADLGRVAAGEAYQTAAGAIVVHDLDQGRLVNLLVNTDSGRTYQQDLEITLVLPGFGALQEDMGQRLTGLRLTDELALGSVLALGGP